MTMMGSILERKTQKNSIRTRWLEPKKNLSQNLQQSELDKYGLDYQTMYNSYIYDENNMHSCSLMFKNVYIGTEGTHQAVQQNIKPLEEYFCADLKLEDIKKSFDKKLNGLDNCLTPSQKKILQLGRALQANPEILQIDDEGLIVEDVFDSAFFKLIELNMSKCSLVAIIKRLENLIFFDKVLVLHNGEIKDFDNPMNQQKNEQSFLCKKIVKSNTLRQLLLEDVIEKSKHKKLKKSSLNQFFN